MIELTFVADALTPVAAYAALRAAAPGEPSFLLESVVGGERWGRYSILGYRPRYEARLVEAGWQIVALGDSSSALPRLEAARPGDPLGPLSAFFARRSHASAEARSTAAKLAHAHVGFFAWDLVHALDKVPGFDATHPNHTNGPRARLLGGGTIVVFDALAQTVTIAAQTEAEVERARQDLMHVPPLSTLRVPDRRQIPASIAVGTDDETFCQSVQTAQEYIKAGDAFQIVLSRTFSVAREGRDPFDVYRAMRLINPSPYMYFLDFPGRAATDANGQVEAPLQIAGASPETLVRREAGKMTVRPIAGTRARGKTTEEDEAMEAELRADPKENAEHVMLIDLGRNDVGRVADVGSVKLVRMMEIERYSHVMHIVSEVEGRVPNEKVASLDVLRAAFPAGTLSGAPKVRAMQIIRELEDRPRGVYGGAVGYLADNGDLDLAIAIRTAVFHGDRIDVTAGAGIVDASDPQSEAEETRSKARGVLCAIEAASSRLEK